MTVFWPWGGVWRWRVVEEEEEGWEEDFKEGNTHSRLLTTPPSLFLWWYLSSPPPPNEYASPTAQYTNTNRVINPSPDSCVSFPGRLYLTSALLWKKKKCSPPEWLNANWLMWCYSPCARHWTQRTHKAAQLLHEPVCLRWPMHIKDTFPFSRW